MLCKLSNIYFTKKKKIDFNTQSSKDAFEISHKLKGIFISE